nr:GTP 3',8-cyclase MoaA [Candidatus Sigynarchaeota archaeon]
MDLVDKFNRRIDYLRLSVNRNCNFACSYCDKEGYATSRNDVFLNPDDASAIVRIFNSIGNIKKVKITGGEPLLHPEIIEVVHALSSIPTVEEISLTTNGYLLPSMARALKRAGLARVNVSLCSLDKETFKKITGVDGIDRVIAGIDAAFECGLVPLKVNFVLLRGYNDHELESMIEFCGRKKIRLQIIELHEIDGIHEAQKVFFENHFMDVNGALEKVTIPVERVEYRHMQHRKIIFFTNGASVETVKVTPAFCEGCNKIRVTAAGMIKPCLMQASEPFDLLDLIRKERPMNEMKDLISNAISSRKPYMMNGASEKGCH